MKGFFTTDDELNKNNRLKEKGKQFVVEFNRYYFTKQYEKAFDLCINNMADEENRHIVYAKAQLAIEKLTNRIELSDKSRINKDWVIDALVNYGHKNMKLNGDEIKTANSRISVASKNIVKIEGQTSLKGGIIVLLYMLVMIASFFIACGISYYFHYRLKLAEDSNAILTSCLVISFYIITMYKLISMQFEFRKLIRKLAASILYEYNNL